MFTCENQREADTWASNMKMKLVGSSDSIYATPYNNEECAVLENQTVVVVGERALYYKDV